LKRLNNTHKSNKNISRRQFIKAVGLAAGGALVGGNVCDAKVYKGKTSKFTTGMGCDVTFFITTDLHYGLKQSVDNEQGNKDIVAEMNTTAGNLNYPVSVGGKLIEQPRGVLVAGDLTELGKESEYEGYDTYDGFADDYDGLLNYPVYEAFGNHDCTINGTENYTKNQVKVRNQTRPGISNVSSNGFHYSWDWDSVHFVNLNLYPGPQGGRTNEAEGSIDFLVADLAANVGDSGWPVVIYHHFGMDPNSLNWWTDGDRDTYYEAIKDYNVIAILHGHSHVLATYEWRGIDVYDIGTGKSGHWAVMQITDAELIFASRNRLGWAIVTKKALNQS